jgi:hypothetical protein
MIQERGLGEALRSATSWSSLSRAESSGRDPVIRPECSASLAFEIQHPKVIALEQYSILVDQDFSVGFGLVLLGGSLGEFSAGEGCPGADQGDEVGRIDGAPMRAIRVGRQYCLPVIS